MSTSFLLSSPCAVNGQVVLYAALLLVLLSTMMMTFGVAPPPYAAPKMSMSSALALPARTTITNASTKHIHTTAGGVLFVRSGIVEASERFMARRSDLAAAIAADTTCDSLMHRHG